MTNASSAVAARGPAEMRQGVPPEPMLPEAAGDLAALVAGASRLRSDFVPDVSQADRDFIAQAAREYREVLRKPADAAAVMRWLTPINCVLRNPQSPKAIEVFASALVMMFDDLPAAAFNLRTQQEAARKWQFFPSGGEVLALVEPLRAAWLDRRAAYESLKLRLVG